MLKMSASDVSAIVTRELEKFRIPEAAVSLKQYLVEPIEFEMTLFYVDDAVMPAWEIALLPKDFRIVYAPKQSEYIWGILDTADNDEGCDGCWYCLLEDAFFESSNWNGSYPENYEVS